MSAAELERLLRNCVPAAPDELRARVRALHPEPRRGQALPSRRVLLLLAPACVALGVAAAAYHGISSPSSPQRVVAGETSARDALQKAPQSSAAGGSSAGARLSPSIGAAPAVGSARLTRYEASLRLRVAGAKQVAEATSAATRIARSFGGYAASVEYHTPAGSPGQAFLELRIPTARVQDAVARLSSLGTILSQRVSTRDLQRDLERETAQIAQLRQTIKLTLAALRDPGVTPVQRVQLQLRLASTKRALAQRTHARGATIAEGSLARVSLVLTSQAVAVTTHQRDRLDRMLHRAVDFLGLEATVALYVLVVVSPLAALLLLLLGAAVARRRREERRLLSAR
jgi:Domain of unknown function (DUF4349)